MFRPYKKIRLVSVTYMMDGEIYTETATTTALLAIDSDPCVTIISVKELGQ